MIEAEQRGEARGIQILIADHIEEEVPKEKTIAKLQKHDQLSASQAKKYYEKYSKNTGRNDDGKENYKM